MRAAVNARTRLVFIANPNNPTGTWLAAGELEAFIQSMPAHVLVVVDEAYFEYVNEAAYPNTIAWIGKYPNLVTTRTFSKAYGLAGLRVGYAVSSPEMADVLNRVRQPFNVNSIALAAATAALGDEMHVAARRPGQSRGHAVARRSIQVVGAANSFHRSAISCAWISAVRPRRFTKHCCAPA